MGLLPGCGQHQGLVKAYQLARQYGQSVVCFPDAPDHHRSGRVGHLPEWEVLSSFPQELRGLWNDEVLRLVKEAMPDMVLLDSLNRFDLSAEQHAAQRQNILALLEVGIHVESTLDVVAINQFNDLLNPTYQWPIAARVSPSFLRQAVGDYVVYDLPPTLILQRFYEGSLSLPRPLELQRGVFTNIANLSRLREALFVLVGTHVTDQVRASNPELNDLNSASNSRVWSLDMSWWNVVYVLGGGGVLISVLHYLWLNWYLSLSGVSVVLLGAVVLTALSYSFATTMFASVVAFIGLDYLFMSPFGKEEVRLEDVMTLVTFVCVGAVVGFVATRRQATAERDRASVLHHKALLRLSYDLNTIESMEEAMDTGVRNLERVLGTKVFLVLVEREAWTVRPEVALGDADREAIRTAVKENTFMRARGGQVYHYCPLYLSGRVLGVMGIGTPAGLTWFDPSWQALNFLRNYANMLAGGLARLQLKAVSNEASMQATRESLRSALLSSISHDLKTPLVGIIGSLSTLEHAGKGLPVTDQQELVTSSRIEAERLHSIIHNVLEVTKLESGSLEPKRETVAPFEIIHDALKRAQRTHEGLVLRISAPEVVPDLLVDPILVGQVFYNVFDNAAKYAGVSEPLDVSLEVDGGRLRVEVADHGPGIFPGEEERVFDKFFRTEKRDYRVAGSGLGLAICRGIVEAHGGEITAGNRDVGRGAVFRVWLPLAVRESEDVQMKDENHKEVYDE